MASQRDVKSPEAIDKRISQEADSDHPNEM